MDGVEQNRLKWKCRRGLLELDLVLQRFLPQVHDAEAVQLNAILEMPDNDLWDIVIGRSNEYDPGLKDIVARLRAA
jgi:succinate dehydrogenase flavin-adding protein (antitoxin of CptAB toxin-antitoxin module)